MSRFTFTDRATYLAFRKQWKINYAELSNEIRDTRAAIRTAYAEGRDTRAFALQSTKAGLRRDARYLLSDLADAKKEAQRQYLAEREAKVAA
jgi:hypothetical protein